MNLERKQIKLAECPLCAILYFKFKHFRKNKKVIKNTVAFLMEYSVCV